MTVARGQFVALYGPSGSGKTTLLDMIIGLRSVPDSGSIRVDGREIAGMSNAEADEFRLHKLGIIGEAGVLQPGASAIRAAAIRVAMDDARHAERRVAPLLVRLGLGDRLKHRVEQLSMGERQRVVIALALSTNPQLVLADEPTGHLDAENTRLVLTLLRELCRERGVALLLATHDREAAAFADEVHELRDGRVKQCAADSALVLADVSSRAGRSCW